MNFEEEYRSWQQFAMSQFKQTHPSLKKDRIELCEDGTVFVHYPRCSSPYIFRNAVRSWDEWKRIYEKG